MLLCFRCYAKTCGPFCPKSSFSFCWKDCTREKDNFALLMFSFQAALWFVCNTFLNQHVFPRPPPRLLRRVYATSHI